MGTDKTSRTLAENMKKAALEGKYAKKLGIVCEEVGPGTARASMMVTGDMMNLFGMAHGGAIFSLMDDVFQLACNSRGLSAFALNVSTTFIKGAVAGDRLTAEAVEIALTARTGTYELKVRDANGEIVAAAQAVAYRKKDPPPFIDMPG